MQWLRAGVDGGAERPQQIDELKWSSCHEVFVPVPVPASPQRAPAVRGGSPGAGVKSGGIESTPRVTGRPVASAPLGSSFCPYPALNVAAGVPGGVQHPGRGGPPPPLGRCTATGRTGQTVLVTKARRLL